RFGQCLSLLLLPAVLAFGGGVAAQDNHAAHAAAQAQASPSEMRQMRWSDPAAWPAGKVPGEGEAVVIPAGTDMLLDVVPAPLRSLTIEGRLRFADDRDLELRTEWIYIPGGELAIGSEQRPHTRQATIVLTDEVPGEDVNT